MLRRDQQERDALVFQQLEQRRVLQARMERLRNLGDTRSRFLSKDRGQYEEIKTRKRETARFKARGSPSPLPRPWARALSREVSASPERKLMDFQAFWRSWQAKASFQNADFRRAATVRNPHLHLDRAKLTDAEPFGLGQQARCARYGTWSMMTVMGERLPTCASSTVAGLSADGDGFLAVRSGSGSAIS